jgi:hypothetical protein
MDQNNTIKAQATSTALKCARKQLVLEPISTTYEVNFLNAFFDKEKQNLYAVNTKWPNTMYVHASVTENEDGYSFKLRDRIFTAPHSTILDSCMATIHPGGIWTIIGRRGNRYETQTYTFCYGHEDIKFDFESIL